MNSINNNPCSSPSLNDAFQIVIEKAHQVDTTEPFLNEEKAEKEQWAKRSEEFVAPSDKREQDNQLEIYHKNRLKETESEQDFLNNFDILKFSFKSITSTITSSDLTEDIELLKEHLFEISCDTSQKLTEIIQKHPFLKNSQLKLSLKKCSGLVMDSHLKEVAKECHGLKELDLSLCEMISNACLIQATKQMPNLTKLTLQDCRGLNSKSRTELHNAIFVEMMRNLPNLKLLNLQGVYGKETPNRDLNNNENNNNIKHNNLEYLSLCGDPFLTDSELTDITAQFPNLKVLNLGGTQITKQCFADLQKNCPKLKFLFLARCPEITSELDQIPLFAQLHTLFLDARLVQKEEVQGLEKLENLNVFFV